MNDDYTPLYVSSCKHIFDLTSQCFIPNSQPALLHNNPMDVISDSCENTHKNNHTFVLINDVLIKNKTKENALFNL